MNFLLFSHKNEPTSSDLSLGLHLEGLPKIIKTTNMGSARL